MPNHSDICTEVRHSWMQGKRVGKKAGRSLSIGMGKLVGTVWYCAGIAIPGVPRCVHVHPYADSD